MRRSGALLHPAAVMDALSRRDRRAKSALLLRILVLAATLAASSPASASEQDLCAAHFGTLLTGTVMAGPRFAHGRDRRGVELSHTHLLLQGDDGQRYDIAIDDVFAAGYDAAGERVPAPLFQLRPGTRLELCGKPYTSGGPGMDEVHVACSNSPTPRHPDGWLKVVGTDGALGPNLEASREYCRLFRRR